jgi:hypothetical protein
MCVLNLASVRSDFVFAPRSALLWETMAAPSDMHTFVQTTIPKALSDLLDSNNNIKQIATYCKSAYLTPGEQPKVYDQTREYTKECILNVAYHVQTIGTHISTLLDLQATEIDKLDIQIRALSDVHCLCLVQCNHVHFI